jgi:anti-sigma factor RsiW
MRCSAVEELLPFYPRGDLSREAFGAVTRHLAGCPRCRRALAEVQATYRLLQGHLYTAPAGDPGRAKGALLARLGATGEEPPEGAPVPARRRPATLPPRREVEPWPEDDPGPDRDPGPGLWPERDPWPGKGPGPGGAPPPLRPPTPRPPAS